MTPIVRRNGLTPVLRAQGVYYTITGLWPFAHLESFVAVVGPKADIFQLHVTSALIVVIAAVLLYGSRRAERSVILLSSLSAAVFIGLELAYARQLRDIYWLDTVLEALILGSVVILSRSPDA